MRTYPEIFDTYSWEEARDSIFSKTANDVESALTKKTKRTPEDFKSLVSPAAGPYLEEMAALSHRLTRKRFGKTIQLYAPMYLSNECQNICHYCAFSYDNNIKRITLGEKQVEKEISALKKMGFDHILIVTGEANRTVGMDYFRKILPLVRQRFSHISFEVQPLEEKEYKELASLGVNTVLVYQETYNREQYKSFHPKGKKSNFYYRLETPDRLGRAGIHKIGLGVLLGLGDPDKSGAGWRTDSFFCAMHLQHLEKTYWQTKYSVSFPRLRPIEIASYGDNGGHNIFKTFDTVMTDRELVQLICAYRIFNEEAELSISTRESENFRNHIIKLGITNMSAGSRTNPGGYTSEKQSLEQFEVSDERSPEEISGMLRSEGYEPVWKDWDRSFELQL